MASRFFFPLFFLNFSFAFIGKSVLHRQVSIAHPLIQLFVNNEADFVSPASPLRIETQKEKDRAVSKAELEKQFSSKIKSFSSDRDFALYLKSCAVKRVTLSRSDRRQLASELIRRVPSMSVHSISDVIWSMGTLKLPTKNLVRIKVNRCHIIIRQYVAEMLTSSSSRRE
jgi:hypothetical protein